MKRRKTRLLLGFVLPPTLGVLFVFLMFYFLADDQSDKEFSYGILVAGFPIAFILLGIQSLIFSFVMEYLINPQIKNNTLVIVTSGALGFLAVLSLSYESYFLMIVGTFISLVVGSILRRNHINSANNALLPANFESG